MRKIITSLFFPAFLFLGLIYPNRPTKDLPPEQKQELLQYLKHNWQSPEDYVIDKFEKFDIVFIGEAHHIKHDVELIHNLIPRLYQAGIYNLAIEFGCAEYQDKADALTTAEAYDADLARWLLFKWGSYWPYKEYLDIYRKTWELNISLPPDAPRFRVVHLDYRPNWNLVKEGMTDRQYNRVFHKGDRDEYMAKILQKELIENNKKVLVYAGAHHAFTHYNLPDYDHSTQKVRGYHKNRMGNLIYRKFPHKVFNICLHYPWPTQKIINEFNYPVDGMIDQIMGEFEDQRVGFNVKNSPFGLLRDEGTYYSAGYDDFNLSFFCDGYIYQKPISAYEGCTVDPLFITKINFKEAIEYLPNPRLKTFLQNPQHFLSFMRSKTDMKKKFGDLE